MFGALYVGGSYKGYFGTNFPQGWCLSLPTSSPLRKNKENCCKIPSGCGGNSYRLRLTNEQALLSMQPTNTQCSHEISVGVLGNIHIVVTHTIETFPGTTCFQQWKMKKNTTFGYKIAAFIQFPWCWFQRMVGYQEGNQLSVINWAASHPSQGPLMSYTYIPRNQYPFLVKYWQWISTIKMVMFMDFPWRPFRKRGGIPMAMLENYDSRKPTSHSYRCISRQMPSTTLDCHATPSRRTFVERVETIKAQDIRPTRWRA